MDARTAWARASIIIITLHTIDVCNSANLVFILTKAMTGRAKSYAFYAIKLKDIRLCTNRTSHKVPMSLCVRTLCAHCDTASHSASFKFTQASHMLVYAVTYTRSMYCRNGERGGHESIAKWEDDVVIDEENEEEEAEQACTFTFYCHARLENVIKYPITLDDSPCPD